MAKPDDRADIGLGLNEKVVEPVARPAGTRINLAKLPGNRFRAVLPAGKLDVGALALLAIDLGWFLLLVAWLNNVPRPELKLACYLALPQWPIIGYLTLRLGWRLTGRVELSADQRLFVRTRRLFGFTVRSRVPVDRIEGVHYRIAARAFGKEDDRSLALIVGGKRVPIAANLRRDEFAWLRYELLAFLNSLGEGAA